MTYAKQVNFPGGDVFTITDFDPARVLGRGYMVSSPDEELAHFNKTITVRCSNCDKTEEGTAEELERRGFWLRQTVVCSIECLFALADAITAKVDEGNLPF